jgi:flavin reductase (DIM6/NTAB) family NADH-FMN oxidoreductase RutF
MFLDPATTPDFKRTLFNAIVAPRPIGWISTMNSKGQVNLAPFSHFNLVSTAPPVVIFSCNAPADRHEKDTITNVRETGEFVTNLVTWDLRNQMNLSSIDAPYGTDEFELAGLEKAPSVMVKPPRVAASPASMECRLLRIVDIEPTGPGETASNVRASGRSLHRRGRAFRYGPHRTADPPRRQPLRHRRPHGRAGPPEPAARLIPQ